MHFVHRIFCVTALLLLFQRYDATAEDLIDVVEGNRVYIPCIYVLNKIDQISIEVGIIFSTQ